MEKSSDYKSGQTLQQPKSTIVSNITGKRQADDDLFASYLVSTNVGVQEIQIKDNKLYSLMLLQGENIKYTLKFNEVLFVVGVENEMDLLIKGKAQKQQFMNTQLTAIDFDTQELIGKISFKHQIFHIEIKGAFLLVSFTNKIIVCDVMTLKHLFKIQTDDKPVFDSWISSENQYDDLKIAYLDFEKENCLILECYSIIKPSAKKNSIDDNILRKDQSEVSTNTHSTQTVKTDTLFNINKVTIKIESKLLSNVVYLKFNHQSTYLAAVSNGGKHIYIVDVATKQIKAHLYRGLTSANVKSISFSLDNQFLALSSDKLSVHIFHIGAAIKKFEETGQLNKIRSIIKFSTQDISDVWEFKVQQRTNNVDITSKKKSQSLAVSHDLNTTIPLVNFLRNTQKPGSIFELELISEKGYYYRIAFQDSRDIPGKQSLIPDNYDVYCEIKVVISQHQPNQN